MSTINLSSHRDKVKLIIYKDNTPHLTSSPFASHWLDITNAIIVHDVKVPNAIYIPERNISIFPNQEELTMAMLLYPDLFNSVRYS